ncbi:MAG: hypothetical protein ACYC99_04310 [Candidatus Geothermincolia bacterium]
MDSLTRNKAAALTIILAVFLSVALVTGGCVTKASVQKNVQKYDLTGQLKRINKEVSGLNKQTISLVDVIQALDTKEGQLNDSVVLLKAIDGGAGKQIATIKVLSGMVKDQKSNVAGVLGVANEVMTLESGLKTGTQAQLDMSGTTLTLVNALMGNLTNFKNINDNINQKMDVALDLMNSM